MRTAVVAAAVALVVGVAPAAADTLTVRDKHVMEVALLKQSCVDCPLRPNMRTARWRFASDFGTRLGRYAYASVVYRTFEGRREAALFGFTLYDAKWRLLELAADGSTRMTCGANVLLNEAAELHRQLRLVRRVVGCT